MQEIEELEPTEQLCRKEQGLTEKTRSNVKLATSTESAFHVATIHPDSNVSGAAGIDLSGPEKKGLHIA